MHWSFEDLDFENVRDIPRTPLGLCLLWYVGPIHSSEQLRPPRLLIPGSATGTRYKVLCWRCVPNNVSVKAGGLVLPEHYATVQSQKAISAYITRKQILSLGFAQHYSLIRYEPRKNETTIMW